MSNVLHHGDHISEYESHIPVMYSDENTIPGDSAVSYIHRPALSITTQREMDNADADIDSVVSTLLSRVRQVRHHSPHNNLPFCLLLYQRFMREALNWEREAHSQAAALHEISMCPECTLRHDTRRNGPTTPPPSYDTTMRVMCPSYKDVLLADTYQRRHDPYTSKKCV